MPNQSPKFTPVSHHPAMGWEKAEPGQSRGAGGTPALPTEGSAAGAGCDAARQELQPFLSNPNTLQEHSYERGVLKNYSG